jgi:hypothetical protein
VLHLAEGGSGKCLASRLRLRRSLCMRRWSTVNVLCRSNSGQQKLEIRILYHKLEPWSCRLSTQEFRRCPAQNPVMELAYA